MNSESNVCMIKRVVYLSELTDPYVSLTTWYQFVCVAGSGVLVVGTMVKSLSDGTVTGNYRSAASHHNEFHKLTNADLLSANPDQNKADEQTNNEF